MSLLLLSKSEFEAQAAKSVVLGLIAPDIAGIGKHRHMVEKAPLQTAARIPGPLDDRVELPSAAAEYVGRQTAAPERKAGNQVTAHMIDKVIMRVFGVSVGFNTQVTVEEVGQSHTGAQFSIAFNPL